MLYCHFRKIATVSHFRLVISHFQFLKFQNSGLEILSKLPLFELDSKVALTRQNICYKTKYLCSQSSCDYIQWFQWLQVVVHHGYVTLAWCHMHWSSQKYLEVLIIAANAVHNFSCRPLYL